MLQTRTMSPGNLRPGVIICYDKIKRCASDLCSGYHKIVVLDTLWILRHGNSSAVVHGEKPSEKSENVGGAVHRLISRNLI